MDNQESDSTFLGFIMMILGVVLVVFVLVSFGWILIPAIIIYFALLFIVSVLNSIF